MTDPKLIDYCTTDIQRETIEAVIKHGSANKAAKKMGKGRRAIDRTLKRVEAEAARRGYAPEHDMTHDTAPGYVVKGTSTLYDADGNIKLQWSKTDQDKERQRAAMAEFVEGLIEDLREQKTPQKIPAPKGASDGDLATFFVVGDAHIGMRAYGKATGGDDHDTKIGVNDLYNAFQHLINASPSSEVGYLVNVGDLFHANDATNKTQGHGHALDVDGRLSYVIQHAKDLFTRVVQLMLVKFKRVVVVNARGNHDPDAAVFFNEIVAARWHHEPRVTVAPNDGKFIYLEHGDNFIGIHHGDRINRRQIYEAVTRDRRKEWGSAKFSYFWTGHIHHKTAEEIGGMLFESFNILAAVDSWHADSGYGANREMQSIIMSKSDGIVARNVCGIRMARQYEGQV